MTAIKFFAVLLVAGFVAAEPANPFVGVDPNTLSCDPEGHVFLLLPHFEECSKYYMCAHGKEVEFTCPGGLIFDFELQTCNYDRDTKCWLRTSEDEIDGSGDEPNLSEEFVDKPSVDVSPIDPEIASSTLNVILSCRSIESAARQMAYRGDCQRYWRCEQGVPQAVYCSDGLYFNPTKQQCDYEANVKCHVPQEDELASEFLRV